MKQMEIHNLGNDISLGVEVHGGIAVVSFLTGLEPGALSGLGAFIKKNVLGTYGVLVLDLSSLSYISSMALGFLLETYKEAERQGARMSLVSGSRNLDDIFSVTNLDRVLTIHPSLEAALEPAAPSGTSEGAKPLLFDMKLEIGPVPYFVKVVRETILMSVRENYEITAADEMDIALCVGEAVNNSIKHGYRKHELTGKVYVWTLFFEDRVVIAIEDFGAGFDEAAVVNAAMKASSNLTSESGRGIFLMNTLMDEAVHRSQIMNSSVAILVKMARLRENSPIMQ
ncbi:MAG: hypothetical protein CVV64_01480 [Candidatus Wallbacteria bacterium HGW-Wallbacteria-1]|jgi:anti-anti-sigma factor|uniref:Anti-sigma factor antagonist n=1 Tax=Candidatus Wallbacteria bacterium HGW-Wallbacteria-1 TaxID=2013854 RepID=A0A2N1PUU9_9BACT|nr:MAG: hypothetical protein CVV64_01480 [Candidatus Wallbacteria bacterium HGW-Wallbacteria-1]